MPPKSKTDAKCCLIALVLVLAMIGVGIGWSLVDFYYKPSQTIDFTLASHANAVKMIPMGEGYSLTAKVDADHDVIIRFLDQTNYYKMGNGSSYTYEEGIDGYGSFSTDRLPAGNYYLVYGADAQPSTGTITYTIDSGSTTGQTVLIIAIVLSGVITVLAIVIAQRHGAKVKIVDKYGKEVR